MPDAAARDDMLRGDAPMLLRLRLLLLRTPLALPLLGVVGALLGGAWWGALVAASALAAVLRLWRIMLCMLLCAAIAAVHESMRQRDIARALEAWAERDAVEMEGTVVDMLGRGCLLRVAEVGVTVALRGEDIPYREGDRVRVLAALREVEPPPVEGMFDRSLWMRSRGIAAEANFIRGERLGNPFSWAMLRGCATSIRHALAERLMPPGTESDPRHQILCALVLGARELADPGTMLPFRRGGTLHAFAVSGMHVVMLSGFLWALLRVLRVSPSVGRWLQLLVLGGYVLITGFSVPAVRACIMLVTLLMGLTLRRRVGLANCWCFAALLVLLLEPWQLWSAGFLLSFAIYAAICFGLRVFMHESPWLGPDAYLPPRIYTQWDCLLRGADATLRGTVLVALVAWLVSLPLNCLLFHTMNPWGFATNIAVAAVIPIVMAAGMALLLVSAWPAAGALASWVALRASGLLLTLTSWFAYVPGAYLAAEVPRPPQAAMILATGFGGSVCVLGNPGIVIDCGNETTAALQVEPALFHSGFQPATLLLSQPTQSHGGGAAVMQASWPKLQLIRAEEIGVLPLHLEGRAGRFTLYPPPVDLPRRPAANASPIIRWEMADGRSLLYVGNASRATWEELHARARVADILILGANPNQPMDDPALLRAVGAKLIVLLPSAAGSSLNEEHAGQGARLIRLGERQCLMLP